jgi:hypothetical protein
MLKQFSALSNLLILFPDRSSELIHLRLQWIGLPDIAGRLIRSEG